MISIVILSLLLGSSYCAAQTQTRNFTIPDDQESWKAMWKIFKKAQPDGTSAIADSTRPDLFDIILKANAQARSKSKPRSGETEFLFQGDIAMTRQDVVSLLHGGGAQRRKRAVMRKLAYRLWRPNNIAYVIGSDLGSFSKRVILSAIKRWEDTLPCMGKWQDISKLDASKRPRDYIRFLKGEGCYSKVGRQGGRQVVSIGSGCEQIGVVIHEIGHAMGFWHEQSRTDRDNYVVINWNNILPAMRFNFEKYPSSQINDLGVGYDYQSVMHYGSRAFSKDGRSVTISIKPEKNVNGARLGQRYHLSDKDKEQAQLLYNCKSKPLPCSSSPCLNGGVCKNIGDKYSCSCTSGYTGVRCDKKITKPVPCSSSPCLNGGVCSNNGDKYHCACTLGYTGVRCEKLDICVDKDLRCSQWVAAGYCDPALGYGNFMKRTCCASCLPKIVVVKPPPCSSSPCLNGGVCRNNGDRYSCSCTPRYAGRRCETKVHPCSSSPCFNNGMCTNIGDKFGCRCTSRYRGTRCERKVQPCDSSPCFNGGVCRNNGDKYSCSCTSSYTGTRCQVRVQPCSSSPCLNGGVCRNNGNKYSCRCTSDYSGKRCETKIQTTTATGCTGNKQTQSNCKKWKAHCASNSSHYLYMKTNCCKTCERNCRDKNSSCRKWSENGYCKIKDFKSFMQRECIASCGLC